MARQDEKVIVAKAIERERQEFANQKVLDQHRRDQRKQCIADSIKLRKEEDERLANKILYSDSKINSLVKREAAEGNTSAFEIQTGQHEVEGGARSRSPVSYQ